MTFRLHIQFIIVNKLQRKFYYKVVYISFTKNMFIYNGTILNSKLS